VGKSDWRISLLLLRQCFKITNCVCVYLCVCVLSQLIITQEEISPFLEVKSLFNSFVSCPAIFRLFSTFFDI